LPACSQPDEAVVPPAQQVVTLEDQCLSVSASPIALLPIACKIFASIVIPFNVGVKGYEDREKPPRASSSKGSQELSAQITKAKFPNFSRLCFTFAAFAADHLPNFVFKISFQIL